MNPQLLDLFKLGYNPEVEKAEPKFGAPVPVQPMPPPRKAIADTVEWGPFNTNAYLADAVLREMRWKNETKVRLQVCSSTLWPGAAMGRFFDIIAVVYRSGDGSLLHWLGCDRYSDPPGTTHDTKYFHKPRYLEPDEEVVMQYAAVPADGIPLDGDASHHAAMAHHALFLEMQYTARPTVQGRRRR